MRTARGGKDSVDHPPNGHDDLANAACGALVLTTAQRDEIADVGLPVFFEAEPEMTFQVR